MSAEPTLRQVVVFLDHLGTILESTTALSTHVFAISTLSESLELSVHHMGIADWGI